MHIVFSHLACNCGSSRNVLHICFFACTVQHNFHHFLRLRATVVVRARLSDVVMPTKHSLFFSVGVLEHVHLLNALFVNMVVDYAS